MVLMLKRLNLRNKINSAIIKNGDLVRKRAEIYKEFTLMSNIYNSKKALHIHMTTDKVLSPDAYKECCNLLQDSLKMAYELNYFKNFIHKNSSDLHYLDLILAENYPYACAPYGCTSAQGYMMGILHHCDGRLEHIDRQIVVLEGHIEDGEREIVVLTELIKQGVDENGKPPAVPKSIPKIERSPAFVRFAFDNFSRQSKFKFTCGQEHPFKELESELRKVPEPIWN